MKAILEKLNGIVCSALYWSLFSFHVMLAVWEWKPLPWLSQWMFYVGRKRQRTVGDCRKKKMEIQELLEPKDHHHVSSLGAPPPPRNLQVPLVIRGFFRNDVTVDELVKYAGPSTPVQTHAYEKDELQKDVMSLKDLVHDIRQRGKSTNAKSVTFSNAHEFPIFAGLKQRVDALRGTLGMPWGEFAMQFFIGGTGTLTRCHADPSVNCYLQLCGTKRWRIAPPSAASELSVLPRGHNISYNAHCGDIDAVNNVDWLVVDLQPGDLLVLPPFWFHEVTNLVTTLERMRKKDDAEDDADAEDDIVVGMAMNWLSLKHALAQSVIMTAGSFLTKPRLWKRCFFTSRNSVDDELMRACRQVCSCSVGKPQEKTAVRRAICNT